ncbi:hypothetical protein CSE899_06097 [Cronobacter sakazakii E899]|nr:hypothetical protein CSE899_06097 [Cronobacter sakazakii E899]
MRLKAALPYTRMLAFISGVLVVVALAVMLVVFYAG